MPETKMSRFTILMAEDDPDDRFIVEQAFLELGSGGELRFVEDGEELMHYLRRDEKYVDCLLSPWPAFILMDVNMPKKDGLQALLEIKADPDLGEIPVVIWTTSRELGVKIKCEEAGADFCVTKPDDYPELANWIQKLVLRYCVE